MSPSVSSEMATKTGFQILGYDEVKSGTNNFPSTIGAFGCVLFVFNAFLTLQTEQVCGLRWVGGERRLHTFA